MRTASVSVAMLVALSYQLHAQAADPNFADFGWFAELRDACWQGAYPDGKAADTQCYSTQYDRVIRGTIKMRVEREGAPATTFEGDSIFAWEPAKKKVVFTQWGSNGSYGQGELAVEADVLRFQNRLPDGSESKVRSVWRRIDGDTFRVTRERRDGDSWKEAFSVDYRRVR